MRTGGTPHFGQSPNVCEFPACWDTPFFSFQQSFAGHPKIQAVVSWAKLMICCSFLWLKVAHTKGALSLHDWFVTSISGDKKPHVAQTILHGNYTQFNQTPSLWLLLCSDGTITRFQCSGESHPQNPRVGCIFHRRRQKLQEFFFLRCSLPAHPSQEGGVWIWCLGCWV